MSFSWLPHDGFIISFVMVYFTSAGDHDKCCWGNKMLQIFLFDLERYKVDNEPQLEVLERGN